VANERGELPLQVLIDDREAETHSSYSYAAGGRALVISTVLPQRGLAFELISTYVGYPGVLTQVTHLAIGPVGYRPVIEHDEEDEGDLSPALRPRACAYDHAHQLIEHLCDVGFHAGLRVDERTFTALERVE